MAIGTLFACSGEARCPETAPAPAHAHAPAPAPEPSYQPEMHLGDGTTSHNYWVIAEYLRANPGSAAQTAELEKREREAAKSSGEYILKPPSANVVESELSHLLGAIARDNGGVGAAVFDNHGLKVAAAGEQLDGLVLSADRRAAVAKIGDLDPSLVVRRSGLTARYRPVVDHENDGEILGVSALITR